VAAGGGADRGPGALGAARWVDPDADGQSLSNLVWAGGAGAVRDVWVAGERALDAGEPTRVDAASALADARAVARRLRAAV